MKVIVLGKGKLGGEIVKQTGWDYLCRAEHEITIDNLVNNQSPHQPEIVNKVSFTTGLSHQEMQKLTNYSLGTVRTKASKGQSITTQDGSTYSYNKDPNVLKWVQV
jgi:putative ATP-binding cassette transporter